MNMQHVDGLVEMEALGALDAAESDAVRRHAASCPACRRLLAEAEEVVARLALSVPLHRAPAALRARVMRELDTAAPPAPPAPVTPLPRRRGARLRRPPARWATAAALLLVAPLLGLLAWSMRLQTQVNNLQDENRQLHEAQREVVLLSVPTSVSAKLVPTEHAGEARGWVSWNPDAGSCAVVVKNLPRPESGGSYRVFYQGWRGVVEAGELRPDDAGTADVVFDVSGWRGNEYQVWVSTVRHGSEPATVLLAGSLRRE